MSPERTRHEFKKPPVHPSEDAPVADDVARLMEALRTQPESEGVHEGYRALFGSDVTESITPPDEAVINRTIERAWKKLTELQRQILRCRIIDELTLEETGLVVGLSRESVRQQQLTAIRLLRHTIGLHVHYDGTYTLDEADTDKKI